MEIIVTESAYRDVLAQAKKDAPLESCGYLMGPDKNTVTVNYPMKNVDESAEHFSFDPKEQFAAVKYARQNGLTIVGNWHSHPATPSRPSAEDIRLALDSNILYFILSLAEQTPVFNAFVISNGEVREKINIR
ncbi:MAG: M67 family metallopeptidase [Bacteroidales bacterium]|nr:M67 family metallopeptidase [Bacteroidales bacterium]